MASPIIKPDLPERALVNMRNELRIYFGNSNRVDDKLIDSLINDTVQQVHRKWHPKWTIVYADLNVAAGTGVLTMPVNFKKLVGITDQNIPAGLIYRNGINYTTRGFDNSEIPKRYVQFVSPIPDEDLAVRVYYYRRATRAVGDSDLVDIDEDNAGLIRLGSRYKIELQKGSFEEYDRMRQEFFSELQSFIDDDTEPDIEAISRPKTADNKVVDYELGEISGLNTTEAEELRID